LLSTSGLASGNHLEEAVSHGLCELIERDSGTLFMHNARAVHERRVDLGSIDDPICRDIIDRLRSADLALAVWDITSDIGLAAFHCRIMDRPIDADTIAYPAFGEACHSRRAVALSRAIIEAAQARLAAIAGVRDDIGTSLYHRSDDFESLSSWWRIYARNTGRRLFTTAPDLSFENAREEIGGTLAKLRHVGLEQAIVVDLTPPNCDAFAVVRVIVPGLEPLAESGCLPGRRARTVLGMEA
jgi:ribosomal protein S12 methylthiotransferase accessory factor